MRRVEWDLGFPGLLEDDEDKSMVAGFIPFSNNTYENMRAQFMENISRLEDVQEGDRKQMVEKTREKYSQIINELGSLQRILDNQQRNREGRMTAGEGYTETGGTGEQETQETQIEGQTKEGEPDPEELQIEGKMEDELQPGTPQVEGQVNAEEISPFYESTKDLYYTMLGNLNTALAEQLDSIEKNKPKRVQEQLDFLQDTYEMLKDAKALLLIPKEDRTSEIICDEKGEKIAAYGMKPYKVTWQQRVAVAALEIAKVAALLICVALTIKFVAPLLLPAQAAAASQNAVLAGAAQSNVPGWVGSLSTHSAAHAGHGLHLGWAHAPAWGAKAGHGLHLGWGAAEAAAGAGAAVPVAAVDATVKTTVGLASSASLKAALAAIASIPVFIASVYAAASIKPQILKSKENIKFVSREYAKRTKEQSKLIKEENKISDKARAFGFLGSRDTAKLRKIEEKKKEASGSIIKKKNK